MRSNSQCTYCQAVLEPQDITDLPTLPQLKAPPEPTMTQEEIAKNMNVTVQEEE
jgi:hypothetical protein